MSFLFKKLSSLFKFKGSEDRAVSDYANLNTYRSIHDISRLCHAPFKAIRFEQRGVVRTCCYNRQVVLGRYPEMTLKEIWNSAEADALREAVANNNLSYGCQLCSRQLEREEFDTVKLRQYDGLSESPEGYPTMLDFSIHNTCNLECVMCHGEFSSSIRKNREKLPPVPLIYDQGFAKQLEEFIPHAKQFVFAGGEPFLIELYYDIWEAINRLNPVDVHIVTNGTILNNRVKQILENGRYHITHSIESLDKDNYELIRKNAGLERVLENMDYFIDYCRKQGTEYAINVCPIQQNWREIPDLVRFCNERQIRLYLLNVIYPPTASLMSLKSDDLEEIEEYYSSVTIEASSEPQKHNLSNFNDLLSRVIGWRKKAINKEHNQRSVTNNASNTEEVDVSEVFALLSEKVKQFALDNPEVEHQTIARTLERLEKLLVTFEGQKVTKGKLTEMQSIEAEIMIAMVNTAKTEKELDLVVRDHILE